MRLEAKKELALLKMIKDRARKRDQLLDQAGQLREEIGLLYMAGHDKRVPVQKMADAAGVRRESVYHWLQKQQAEVDLALLIDMEGGADGNGSGSYRG